MLALCLLALAVPMPVAGHHGYTEPDDGTRVNFTWTPYTASEGADNSHRPGIDNASYASYSASDSEGGFEKLAYVTVHAPDIDVSGCSSRQTRAFGIDRGDDDPGTRTDESLLDNYERSTFTADWIIVDFYESEDLAGDPASINGSDQLVSAIVDCFGNPEEPGWYQVRGKLNGTTWAGEEDELHPWSHYFYVCDCESRAEAVERLGKPPSQRPGTPTATATPTPTTTATATATATPTATSTPRSAGPPTETARPARDSGASQSTEMTPTVTPTGATETTSDSEVPATPTLAEGPGFGGFVALLGLLAGALLSLRG